MANNTRDEGRAAIVTSLGNYFEHELDETRYRFTSSILTPSCEREDLIDHLADMMSEAKSDPDVTAALVDAAGWNVAHANLGSGQDAVRRGDFAEALAAKACKDIDHREVPVPKLRYQIDPNQTLPGGDVVGFVLSDDLKEVIHLEFIEVKYRTRPERDLAVEAHEQLASDRDRGYATTLSFMVRRLHEINRALYTATLAYLKAKDVRDSCHTIALAFDVDNWRDVVAEKLNDLEKHLPDLRLRLFPFADAANLIEDVYGALELGESDDA